MREGRELVYIERTSGRRAVGVLTRVGGRLPLHASGIGLVLLAHTREAVQREVLEAPSSALPTTRSPTLPASGACWPISADGFVVSDRQVTDDALSVAAPITGSSEVVAALSIVAKASGTVASRLAPAVRAAALGTSRALSARRRAA